MTPIAVGIAARTTVESLESRTLLAATLPQGFEESTVYSGLIAPTSMQIAPDGRIFVSEKGGDIRIIKNGQLLSTPFMSLQVDTFRDRGLSAIELDPNFSSNGYIYVHYNTYDPAKPDQQNNASKVRLSRFTANGDQVVGGSEQILVNNVPSDTGFHPGGFLDFGPDGKIYVGFGTPDVTRYSQDLMSFAGKVLRINPDGTAPTDNPFYGDPNARGAIWAYGFRNPFTGAVDPVTGKIFVNDVGENSYEEVNELKKGKNYGWPNSEGYTTNTAHENPFYAYDHSFHPNGEAAVTGGLFYRDDHWPSEYQGKYFFADYDEGTLRYLDPSVSRQATIFGTGLFRAVDLDQAPDGNLYYLSIWAGEIRKISYVGAVNRNPNAVASATSATSGLAPLNVSFTGNGTSDPDGDSLTYSWNFGNGQTAVGKDVSHTFNSNGTYQVVLTVTDGNGGSDQADPITITVGNNAPTGTITSPNAGSTYAGGQTINFAGTGTDQQDGTLPASAFKWTIGFFHGTDAQSSQTINGVKSGSFDVPTQSLTDPNQFYRLTLTVTDSSGLTHVTSRDIVPQTASITLNTNVPGLTLFLDNQPRTSPYTFTGVVGLTRNLGAPQSQSLNGVTYTFVSWSDGGAANHNISSPASATTYTATYATTVGSTIPGTIQIEDFDDGAQGTAYFDNDTANQGGAYRNTRVDIQASGDTGGGFNVGWTTAGEWLNYTLNATSAGTYDIEFRVASKALGGTFHLEIDGVDVTGPMQVPNTGDWQTYTTITKTGVNLTVGSHVARLVMDAVSSSTGNVGNFNWMRFVQSGGQTNQPPVVSMTFPANGATITAGSTVNLTASASDPDGLVTKVEFFVGSTKIGEDLGGDWDVEWTNVQPGTYEITARATDNSGAVTVSAPISVTVSSSSGGPVVNGLTGEYFDNQDLTNPKLTRVDSTVNFNWGTGSPHSSIGPDTFSVRWTGQVQPEFSQQYRFYVDANNGVRLWVNDQLIIDRWTNAWGEVSGLINLTAGVKYNIKLEYFDFDNNANVKLSWSSASRSKQVIPSTRLFSAEVPSGSNQPPSASISSPTGGSTFTAGQNITINANAADTDGNVTKVEFYANGNKIGEDLSSSGGWSFVWNNVSAGSYNLTVVATDDDNATTTSSAVGISVNSTTPPPTTQPGLTGEYFDNQDLTNPKLTRVDSTVNFNWGTGSPHSSIGPDTFSVRWTGFVQPEYSQQYRFYVDANNGVRLWVNDQLIIDRWTNAWGEVSGLINLTAGVKYNIKLEYFDFDNNANVKLSWSSASRSKQVIPQSALTTGDGGGGTPTNQLPSVNITSPGNGASFTAGQTVVLVASASDPDGTIAKVGFFVNGNKIGEDLSGVYDVDWTNVPVGNHVLTAVATDNLGATTTSAPINVTVQSGTGTGTNVTWTSSGVPNSPVRRFESPAVTIGNNVYVFGGWNWDNAAGVLRAQQNVNMYNASTNTWTNLASLPTKLTHQMMAYDGTYIYNIGGFVGDDPGVATATVWRYHVANNTWSDAGFSLPEPMAAGGAGLIGTKLYVFGGSEDDRISDTGLHYMIDLANIGAGWTTRAAMPNARHHFSTAVVNGKIYIFGGQHEHDTETRPQDNTAHVYDPATNAWTQLANLPRTVSHAEPGTFVRDGKIYIGGGMDVNRTPLATLTEYDPVTNSYRELTPLPVGLTAPVVQYVNGKIFVTGGSAASGGAQNTSYLGTWT